MFTGIVETTGTVAERAGGRLVVDAPAVSEGSRVGDSVAVNGACLTVTAMQDGRLSFDLAEETLRRTTLGSLGAGDPVNLERPLRVDSLLGGHLVQGHVDAVGVVRAIEPDGEGAEAVIEVPPELSRYLVEKGSVTVDGVSLTVAEAGPDAFRVALVPHTLGVTTLGVTRPGDRVNVEIDIIAKYVERLLSTAPRPEDG